MQLVQEIQEKLQKDSVSVLKMSNDTGISAYKIYKWLAGKGNPKAEDAATIKKWLSGNLEKVPNSNNGKEQHRDTPLTGAHVTLQDYINKIEEHNVFLQYVIRNGLVSLESNLKTGQLQIQEQLFAVGESLGNQMEGVSLGLAALAKDREVAKKDKDISGKQGRSDGKGKSPN